MFPEKNEYPRFVPDQLLTSEHLNQLFEYLEEQGRLTRTNLIGIGIVCGLEVKTAADGTAITITKGCGVTSAGYLVTVPEVTYEQYKPFNAEKERYYELFVDMATKKQRFPLYELMQEGVEEGTIPLSNNKFLQDKVVLIFVELLEEGNKNCNPNSCDDKGINVTVNFRPLLISKANAAMLEKIVSKGNPGSPQPADYMSLPELHMRRWDVPATNILETADIAIAYRKILDKNFITQAEQKLTKVYQLLRPLVLDTYPANPFSGLAAQFDFLYKNTIETEQLVFLQYYYDLFADLLLAYEELRIKGIEVFSLCCPDGDLFPRHLLLGEAIPTGAATSDYRHYFIPSPVLCCQHQHLLFALRELFRRLVLMIVHFFVPNTPKADGGIRITPSKHGDLPLSVKSIPFYYNVKAGTNHLYKFWSAEKNATQSAHRILSYHAAQYNNTDEFVTQPLLYDLEPYNFLRIEGHVGKPFTQALKSILEQKDQYRLPIAVVALSADVRVLKDPEGTLHAACHFQDLESLYDALIAELKCELCKHIKYYYDLPSDNQQQPYPTNRKPSVTLLQSCDPAYLFNPFTIGHEFEIFYQGIKNQSYIRPQQFFALILKGGNTVGNTAGATAAADIGDMVKGLLFGIIYYIEELSKTLAPSLNDFDEDTFSMRFDDLQVVAGYLRAFLRTNLDGIYFNPATREDIIDHLDELLLACKQSQFRSIVADYMNRLRYANLLRKFGYFIKKHPGVQHKAGVPIGGTFIIVYHEKESRPTIGPPVFTNPATGLNRESAATVPGAAGRAATGRTTAGMAATGRATATFTTETPGIRETAATAALAANPPVSLQLTEVENEFRLVLEGKTSNPLFDRIIADIPNGTVIADFYLPYICSSDCAPIQYILNNITERLSISLDPSSFCAHDDGSYTFTVSPEGGAVTVEEAGGDSVSVGEDGQYRFKPNDAPMGELTSLELTFTYTKDGNTAKCTATLYKLPQVSFTFTPGAASPLSIQFTGIADAGDEYLWNFGDNTTSTEQNPVHTYGTFGNYQVTLQVTNGTCTGSTTRQVPVQQVAMAIPPEIFCSNDQTQHPFVVTPLGGTVTGPGNDGITRNPDGTFVLIPSNVTLAETIAQRELQFSYTVTGQTAIATAKATVFKQPVAAFESAAGTTPLIFLFTDHSSAFAGGHSWDFGDGTTSTEKSPVHTYKDEKENREYTVTLKVTNGPCTATVSQVVSVIVVKEKECLPLGGLLDRFRAFAKNTTQPYMTVKQAFKSYQEVLAFFANLGAVEDDQPKQLELFKDSNIAALLVKWLQQLFQEVINGSIAGPAPIPIPTGPALELYRMLTELTLYISCLQPEDIDKGIPGLVEVFNMINTHLSDLKPEQVKGNEAILQGLLAALEAELKRLVDSKEDAVKPAYTAALRKLIETLKKILNVA